MKRKPSKGINNINKNLMDRSSIGPKCVNQQLFDLHQIISGFIDPYLVFQTYQRYWINYRRRNRELDGAITQIKSAIPVLDSLVKWQDTWRHSKS